jgi:hypothetical protein
MEIDVVRQINSRWRDGRTLSAMEGRRITVDDADIDAVAHLKALIASGDAVEVKKEAEVVPEVANKTLDSSVPPPVHGDGEDVTELDSLRVQAEAVGVKVDRRWGPERLRDEIAAVAE